MTDFSPLLLSCIFFFSFFFGNISSDKSSKGAQIRSPHRKLSFASFLNPIIIRIFASMIINKRYTTLILALWSFLGLGAQELVQCEDTCTHVHGIDLSHYQGDVFWETIGSNSKMAYVYLKATEGGDRIDPKYARNIDLAHQHGLKIGSYHFFRPKTDLTKQLSNFMEQCRPSDQDLIPMIDVETKSGLETQAFCDSLLKFLDLVEKAYKQKPLVYTGTNFYNRYLVGKLDGYKLMIAQYTQREPKLIDERDIFAWQYTGKGHINGVNGYIDKSRLMGSHRLRELQFKHH